jgi:excisionase family DNA binding protein
MVVINENDLTIDQVAALRRVSSKTIRRMVARGACPAGKRLGNNILRFDRAVILRWLESEMSQPARRVSRGGETIECRG